MFQTHFNLQEGAKKIEIEREFAAPLDRVWEAWTDSSQMDKWWAPKPWQAVTKAFEFKAGGRWLYYMGGPKGEKAWSLAEYESIKPFKSFSGVDSFCDENGVKDPNAPQMHWLVEFQDLGKTTKVKSTITFATVADLKKTLEMGFKEGFTMAQTNLDALLTEK